MFKLTRGLFISFEGGDGGGKSSQLRRLAETFTKLGLPVVTTREPGGTPGAEEIRALLLNGGTDRWTPRTEAYLHTAARLEHVEKLIRPALAENKIVLSDRFFDSTVAYQGYGLDLSPEFVWELQRQALGPFKPDRTYIFDIDPKIGLKRACARHGGEDRYERMDFTFHEDLRQGFLEIAKQDPERCRVLDASRAMEPIFAELYEDVMALVVPHIVQPTMKAEFVFKPKETPKGYTAFIKSE